ncbi:MAG: hypothetical protein GY756_14975 [bacterium]|nr:hypothetical protein [bacterium]
MNRRWLITIGIIVLALIVIGVLYENGMLNFKWQGLTMIFAALAGPYTAIKKIFFRDKRVEQMIKKHEDIKKEEIVHREVTDKQIAEKEKRIKDLNKELELAEKRLEVIEAKKKDVDKK